MRKKTITRLTLSLFVLFGLICIVQKQAIAQHTDVFNIDFDKTKKALEKQKAEYSYLEVEEKTKYSILIENDKLEKNDFSVHDLELIEIPLEDVTKYQWHSVSIKAEGQINETQTREAGDLECERARKGSLYWLSDGTKHVTWGIWSFWSCSKDSTEDND